MPWFWDEGYSKEAPEDWEPLPKWREYGDTYRLTRDQIYWAYVKNRGMAQATGEPDDEPCWKFKQEYPANAEEAFQTAGNSFIPSMHVAMARKRSVTPSGAMIIGVDPARGGGDKTGVMDRLGRKLGHNILFRS